MKVFLTGASGYVGTVVLRELLAQGHEVVVLKHTQRDMAIRNSQLQEVAGDITDSGSLRGLMDGCEAVIHLVGIIREVPSRGVTMDRIHVRGTENIVREAQNAGIRRFLHMSALGAREDAKSGYHKSKWAAEEIVRNSGLDYTIFRPSVIFGRGGPGPNFLAQLYDLVRNSPVVPVVGHGNYLLQPVSVRNVAAGFVQGLVQSQTTGKVFEVGGDKQIAYLDILKMIAQKLNKKFRAVYLPETLMRYSVPLLEKLPGFPLTEDQLIMLLEGNTCGDWESYRELGLEPDSFDIIF